MTADQAEQVARLLKAIADPVRLRLCQLVLSHEGGEACVCDLTTRSTSPSPRSATTSRSCTKAGLLDRDKRGVWVYYAVLPEALPPVGHPVRHRHADPGMRPDGPTRRSRSSSAPAVLVAVVVGSGIAAQRLSPDDWASNCSRTPRHRRGPGRTHPRLRSRLRGALQPGRHAGRLVPRRRRPTGRSRYLPVQLIGGVAGAVLANLMFDLPAGTDLDHRRSGGGLRLSEARGHRRAGRAHLRPGPHRPRRAGTVAVGAYIGAAYWCSSSTTSPTR